MYSYLHSTHLISRLSPRIFVVLIYFSVISLQKPRPWFMCAEEGSNMAQDNAVTLTELFGRDKTVALFGVPAPFTGTCTRE